MGIFLILTALVLAVLAVKAMFIMLFLNLVILAFGLSPDASDRDLAQGMLGTIRYHVKEFLYTYNNGSRVRIDDDDPKYKQDQDVAGAGTPGSAIPLEKAASSAS